MPFWLALQAEALHLADRTPEALEAIEEAEAQVERSEERWCCAELHRLRGAFLAAMGAEETQIDELPAVITVFGLKNGFRPAVDAASRS
jgi:hypothetical protein